MTATVENLKREPHRAIGATLDRQLGGLDTWVHDIGVMMATVIDARSTLDIRVEALEGKSR